MENFDSLGLPEALLQSLAKMEFTTPTPIQAACIPLALKGHDILGSAQTGTGKTGGFGIPLVAHLLNSKTSTAIVITPTRELAAQVLKAIQTMMSQAPIRAALLIGGDAMFKQLQQLKAYPRLIVGTPGRINDHLEQGTLDLSKADFLVLDETDKMLDMGFEIQIDRIVKHIKSKRQTLMFSATLPPYIVKLADKYLNKPERIAVGSVHNPIAKISQEVINVDHSAKYGILIEQLNKREGSIIVFVKTKHGADRLSRKLNVDNHASDAIHGDLSQSRRTRVIESFRNRRYRVLVATDVAARGLDIPHIEHVINYDLPQVPEDYIHRIGRTGRAGKEGAAVCFVSPEEKRIWRDIHALMNPGERPEISDLDAARPPKRKYGGKSNGGGGGFRDRKAGGGGFGGQRREGGFGGGQRREGGFRSEGGAPRREGGFRAERSEGAPRDAAPRSEGGFRPERSEAAPRREGGFRPERSEGGYRREGGFNNQRREGGFRAERSEGTPRREGGFRPERSEGGQRREGGFRSERPNHSSEPRREGGFRPERSEGGAPRREGGFRDRDSSGGARREGGFRDRNKSAGGAGRPGGPGGNGPRRKYAA